MPALPLPAVEAVLELDGDGGSPEQKKKKALNSRRKVVIVTGLSCSLGLERIASIAIHLPIPRGGPVRSGSRAAI